MKPNTCKKCNKPMMVEALGDQKKKLSCQTCGVTEIRDEQNRQLLTSDVNHGPNLLCG